MIGDLMGNVARVAAEGSLANLRANRLGMMPPRDLNQLSIVPTSRMQQPVARNDIMRKLAEARRVRLGLMGMA